jgi:hypothetical protein
LRRPKRMVSRITFTMVSILVSPSIFNANFKINIGFEVQPTFCATEVLDNAALPSVASGVSAVTLKDAQDEYQATSPDDVSVSAIPQIHWLIQRYNGKTQDRCNLLKPQVHSPNKMMPLYLRSHTSFGTNTVPTKSCPTIKVCLHLPSYLL